MPLYYIGNGPLIGTLLHRVWPLAVFAARMLGRETNKHQTIWADDRCAYLRPWLLFDSVQLHLCDEWYIFKQGWNGFTIFLSAIITALKIPLKMPLFNHVRDKIQVQLNQDDQALVKYLYLNWISWWSTTSFRHTNMQNHTQLIDTS